MKKNNKRSIVTQSKKMNPLFKLYTSYTFYLNSYKFVQVAITML